MPKFYKTFEVKYPSTPFFFQIFGRYRGARDKMLPSAGSMGEAVKTFASFRSKHLADCVHCLRNSAQILKLKQRSCSSKTANSRAVVIKRTFHAFLKCLFNSVFLKLNTSHAFCVFHRGIRNRVTESKYCLLFGLFTLLCS